MLQEVAPNEMQFASEKDRQKQLWLHDLGMNYFNLCDASSNWSAERTQ